MKNNTLLDDACKHQTNLIELFLNGSFNPIFNDLLFDDRGTLDTFQEEVGMAVLTNDCTDCDCIS